MDSAAVLEFIDSGRNVLIAGDVNPGKAIREIAAHNNIRFEKGRKSVIDHAHAAANDDGSHTLITADPSFQPFNSKIIFGTEKTASVLYRGAALDTDDSRLLVPLMRAYTTAYSGEPNKVVSPDDKPLAGSNLQLMVAEQARNGARVVITGSLDMFSNELIEQSDDADTVLQRLVGVTAWLCQQRGFLRTSNVRHQRVDGGRGGQPGEHYRIGQLVRYEVDLAEWDGAAQRWRPFVADDVQLEFIMLDPYVRQFLKHKSNGHYELEFALPDVYGVFTFRTIYERAGLSPIHTVTRVPVRPLRHDEYERFITSAFPYYASSFSMLVGLFIFSFVFLYHKDAPTKSINKNKKSN